VSHDITLAPLVPWPAIAVLGAVAAVLLAVAIFRGGRGWLARGLAIAVLATALLNPHIAREQRQPQPDLAVVVVDESQSQAVGERANQTERALTALQATLAGFDDLEVQVIHVGESAGDTGTRMFEALQQGLADKAKQRLAGAILITDGQVHDAPQEGDKPALPVPVHVLLTGTPGERDRRLVIERAPAYGLVGREVTIDYRVEETAPAGGLADGSSAIIRFFVNGELADSKEAVVGQVNQYTLILEHAGPTVVELEVERSADEVSNLNNRTAITINGVRDRLRVLLVSGQPHPGERTWRNLLKSDPSVDLIHFTILRPPEKDDATPLRELSLIVFPVDELFQKKLYDFDLIVFDRYIVRGVLPFAYLERIADYLEKGGAVLLSVGPEFAGPRSLFRTPLGKTMPGEPTGRVLEKAFRPKVSELGHRHPVTSGLSGESVSGDAADEAAGSEPTWGHWFRLIEADQRDGEVLMEGPEGRPLLIVQRVGEGRIAQLMSDHIWLWARGYEGGGPQAELLRRLAHWLMKEPELEEESLQMTVENGRLTVERRSLSLDQVQATVTSPSGKASTVVLEPGPDGIARAEVPVSEMGLYRADDGQRSALAAAGTASPLEFRDLRATDARLMPAVKATGGGIAWLADGLPEVRRTKPERDAAGRGWIGLHRNQSYIVTGVSEVPLLPGLLVLVLVVVGLSAAWWREGR
jgi:hypothetical protein